MSTNSEALTQTLDELRRTDRIQLIDSAHVQMLRSMALALDLDPSNAALWKQYREALGELRSDDDEGGSLDDDIDKLFGNADVRNASAT